MLTLPNLLSQPPDHQSIQAPDALLDSLHTAAVGLLRDLIRTPSFSREEGATADLIAAFMTAHGVLPRRSGHNVWATSRRFDPARPTVLLNSHHDTVRPGPSWQADPFGAKLDGDRLVGLGSNDAGAAAVALLAAFLYFEQAPPLPFNLICALTAEEEISGANGVASLLPLLGPLALGIVGEPTQMALAVAERGLLVLDCTAHGRSGHAARNEGDNALYRALADIERLRQLRLPGVSALLGPVQLTVTQIAAGTQHNVVPDRCTFVVDVRTNECYTNAELLALLRQELSADVVPRSLRLGASGIAATHPVVRRAQALGWPTFGSATLSDQALLPFDTVKVGPGDSARSHTPDEYVYLSEIRTGLRGYVALLQGLMLDETPSVVA